MAQVQRSSNKSSSNNRTIFRFALYGLIFIPFLLTAMIILLYGFNFMTHDNSNADYYYNLLNYYTIEINNNNYTTPNKSAFVNEQKQPLAKDTIAYAVSLTDCSKGDGAVPFQIVDGAAVLAHTIHQNSIRNYPNSSSLYDYKLYVIYHPMAAQCAEQYEKLGYTLLERSFPVKVQDMQGSLLRERIEKNGCCGERELIKLEAFALTQHTLVVLLDLDVLLLKPLDYLFDFILHGIIPPSDHLLKPPNQIPEQIDLLYTLDYAMVPANTKVKPVQGGFVVIRSNITIFHDYVDIVRKGDFRENGGWGGKGGRFWGAMTFQGLIPYYFHVLYPGRSIELNWCLYDNMCSPSRDNNDRNPFNGTCLTEQEDCEDCRNRPANDIYAFHFTNCQKPWTCNGDSFFAYTSRLCREMHHAWFEARSSLERIKWGRSGWGPSHYKRDLFNGYCRNAGQKGYIPIELPHEQNNTDRKINNYP